MAVESARYQDDTGTIVIATIDGREWHNIHLDVSGEIADQVKAWIEAGGEVTAASTPSRRLA